MKNRLSLKHLIDTLRMRHEIELRDEDNCRLFNCSSYSQILEPYYNREVNVWFASGDCELVILIGDEENE